MKSAKEMFEDLGYELITNENNDIPRKSWGGELKRFELVYKNEESLILFYKDKSIATVEYGSADDDDRIHFLSYGNNELNILQAINKQVEELHWNDTTVNIDVKLDGKKVMEAMRGGNNA